jgi:hypothetical protein
MTKVEVETLLSGAAQRVTMNCVEVHQHSARLGCLSGDAQDIAIAKLCEELLATHNLIELFFKNCEW